MKKSTLLGMILTCLLGLGLWQQQLLVAKAAPVFNTLTVTNTNDSGAGSSSLTYDTTTDPYTYIWKTERAWRGTCRKLIVKFTDGTTKESLFQFR